MQCTKIKQPMRVLVLDACQRVNRKYNNGLGLTAVLNKTSFQM
jgi:hypothetical protein